jgi:hypothetical protein
MGNELDRQFSKEVQMANKYMRKHLTSLAIKEMQIKIALRFHFTHISVTMAIIKKRSHHKCR